VRAGRNRIASISTFANADLVGHRAYDPLFGRSPRDTSGLCSRGHAEFLERELERRYQSMIDMVLAMTNPFDRVALGDHR